MDMENLLISFMDKDEVVSVFCNPDDGYSAVVGLVALVDSECFVLKEISTEGKYDGYTLRETHEVFRVDYGSYYESSIKKVYFASGQKHEALPKNGSAFMSFLHFIKDHNAVISVGIKDHGSNTVTGYLESFDAEAETLTIHAITQAKEGEFDGYTVVLFDSINRMSCDTEKDRFFQELNSISTGNKEAVVCN